VEDYLSFFPIPRYADIVSAAQVIGRDPFAMTFVPNQTTEIISESELALYFETTGALFTPTQIAGWIWLKIVDGMSPQAIALELIDNHTTAHGTPNEDETWLIHENVWDIISGWAQIGLLRHAQSRCDAPKEGQHNLIKMNWAGQSKIRIGSKTIGLDFGSAALAARLGLLFENQALKEKADINITVQSAAVGYALAVGSRLVATGFGLDNAAQIVSRAVFEQAPHQPDDIAIAGTLIPISQDEAVLFVAGQETEWESALPILCAAKIKQHAYGGVVLNIGSGTVAPIGLPLRIDADDVGIVEQGLGQELPHHVQNWANGGKGRCVASGPYPADKHYKLRTIFVTRRSSEQVDTQVSECTSHTTLAAILMSAIGVQGKIPSGTQVGVINDWLGGCGLKNILFSSPEDAANYLDL
jgi:hypothetical protein